MDNNVNKTDLIKSDEFDKALTDAAKVKIENLTSVKSKNKDNYSRFYEIMLLSRNDIESILDKKKKDRTDSENEAVRIFKKETSQIYRQVCQFIAPENLEDGEPSRIQKIVQKIAPFIKMMNYIGHNEIEAEFENYGIDISFNKLTDISDVFENKQIESDIKEIFERGKTLVEEKDNNNNTIKETIFETDVPHDLRFDKENNPTGIKSSDFCKLVDLKTKMLMAEGEEAQEKVGERINDMAGQVEFDNMRNKIIQTKLMDLQTQE